MTKCISLLRVTDLYRLSWIINWKVIFVGKIYVVVHDQHMGYKKVFLYFSVLDFTNILMSVKLYWGEIASLYVFASIYLYNKNLCIKAQQILRFVRL